MATFRLAASLALIASCYRQDPDVYSTMPTPVEVEGAPSGDFDAEWRGSYATDTAEGSIPATLDASTDPGFAMAATTDTEIDATLAGYGEWIYIEGYGEVWRPYTTVVGVDFTPYETCGSWVWTEWGWTYACEWDWGWLPFHYGRWGWFEDYWAWQPGYEWSPACVDWRGGGGYVGWRPQEPIVRDHRSERAAVLVRDHRGEGPRIRDHRTAKTKDWQWRFAAADDFGKPRIRAHLFKSPAEGLRVTAKTERPLVRASVQPVRAESIMAKRMVASWRTGVPEARIDHRPAVPRGELGTISTGGATSAPVRGSRAQPSAASDSGSIYTPTYQPPAPRPRANAGAAVQQPNAPPSQEVGGLPVQPTTTGSQFGDLPVHPTTTTPEPEPSRPRAAVATPSTPVQPSAPPTTHAPRAPTYTAPQPPTYQAPPSRPSAPPPSYSPPSRPSAPPSSYSPPSRSSSPPPSSYSPPSRSSSPPPSSYSPPSRSSSNSSSGGGSSGGSRSHRR